MVAAAALVASVPVATVGPAEAAFPGSNGKIAFECDRDGDFEIYAMNPGGSDQVRLTANTADDQDPRWSPDGSKVAFVTNRDRDNEIYAIDLQPEP